MTVCGYANPDSFCMIPFLVPGHTSIAFQPCGTDAPTGQNVSDGPTFGLPGT